MDVAVAASGLLDTEADALVVGFYKGEEPSLGAAGSELDRALGGALNRFVKDWGLKGERNEAALYPTDGRVPARRLVLAGLGELEKVDAEAVRAAAGKAARLARDRGAGRLAFTLLGVDAPVGADAAGGVGATRLDPVVSAQATVEGCLLGLYQFSEHKSKKDEKEVTSLLLVAPEAGEEGLAPAIERARVLSEATVLARDLSNQPGNHMTPRLLAEAAERAGRESGFQVEVWDEERIAGEGMGALLGVARGSDEPVRFIIMRYQGAPADSPLLALVGKGLTFDAGGISIKPAEGMHEMKSDKSGGAAVIAAMQAIARLKLPINVVGLVPATENLPGGAAQKPGDVARACNGKTIEVINTDAEGRLILADAVAYADKLGARWIVDIATLTGAVVIALGDQAAAVLGNDRELEEEVCQAGAEVGERYWRLPTFAEYKEQYKSAVADIKNVGGRQAGTITGGLIIGEFVGDRTWAHLDIAGVAWHDKDLPYKPKGATGFGVRTLVRLAERLAERPAERPAAGARGDAQTGR